MRLIGALLLSSVLVGCSASPRNQQAPPSQSAAVRLRAIPDADPSKYSRLPSMRQWRNPYLIVSKDGVSLLDVSNNEEHMLKADELLDTLAALPVSAWPYGRVVAVQETGVSLSEDTNAAIRRNRAILAGTLEDAKVLIDWVPSAVRANPDIQPRS